MVLCWESRPLESGRESRERAGLDTTVVASDAGRVLGLGDGLLGPGLGVGVRTRVGECAMSVFRSRALLASQSV